MENVARVSATIDLGNLAYNYQTLCRNLPKDREVLAVVKADAYGHGAVQVAKTLAREGANCFAVATAEEAFALRAGDIRVPILVLGYSEPMLAKRLARENVIQSVFSSEYADALTSALEGELLSIHVKIDTGMTRLGFDAQDVNAIAEVCRRPCFQAEGIFTHFATADEEEDGYFHKQYALFCDCVAALEKAGVTFTHRHCANSAAGIRGGCDRMNMTRFGISLYGAWPSGYLQDSCRDRLRLKPVMKFSARIVQVRDIVAGTPISYGSTFVSEKNMRIAVVSAGYADGVPRCWSNCGFVTVDGVACPIVGRVCMDMMMVDVSTLKSIPAVGDEAVLFGFGGTDADRAAAWSDSIAYELFCGVSSRVPRIYINQG